jgi:alpha-glucosidase (family GH31 glycosyl hydrolase)
MKKFVTACLAMGAAVAAFANSGIEGIHVSTKPYEIDFSIRTNAQVGHGAFSFFGPNVVKISYVPGGVKPTPSPVLDPGRKMPARIRIDHPRLAGVGELRVQESGNSMVISSPSGGRISVVIGDLAQGRLTAAVSEREHLYGMRGVPLEGDSDPSIFRDKGAYVAARSQGDGGAPVAFTRDFGVFVDSVDGEFQAGPGAISFSHGSRKDIEAYVIVGPPKETFATVAALTGKPPMPPKWSLGFMNSQWGLDEKELRAIIQGYRDRQIPLDTFILDFDYKAWGEDNYGEFRWNGTSNVGNVAPDKFPDGPSGKLGRDLAAQGVHLVGIMKPRVLVTNTKGGPTDAAREALAHNWFLPGQKPYPEYYSGRLANDVDFTTQPARDWFWSHAKGLYQTGISGWWNDEADEGFNSLGFFNMQRALYDGQRSISPNRVFSLNRNFYLGAQRYGFATWSGDINTGFDSMKRQASRMLAILDLGQTHWSMDSGGFGGHPTPENYARWIEFAALVPIMRVHNTFGEKRQPWVYGPEAEAAAKAAIQLRTQMIPTWYQLEHECSETGIGPVRPLFWEFPEDNQSEGLTDEWMIGPSILAAPILDKGVQSRSVYLPPGAWYPWAGGAPLKGHASITTPPDSDWKGIPLFVKAGAITVTQPVQQYVGQTKVQRLQLDVWPNVIGNAAGETYDDDGNTYDYTHGKSISQTFSLSSGGGQGVLTFEPPKGHFAPDAKTYRVVMHGKAVESAKLGGQPLPIQDNCIEVPAWTGCRVELKYRQ